MTHVKPSGPLTSYRILDLSRLLPGGFATALLGDLGAEVIKVEQPGRGDYMRWKRPRLGGTSAPSWITDRNKKSVAIDLKRRAGVEAFLALARTADAVVESFRPGVVDRLGVGYDDVRRVNPALVYCSISGYGQDGPLAGEPGHDVNYIGRAGLLSITGVADGPPVMPGVQVADVGGGGLMALVGLLASLLAARETGAGDHVDVSMTDGAFAFLSIHLGSYFATGAVPERGGAMLYGRGPCYNVYECRDGLWLTVGAIEEQFFAKLCELVGRPDWTDTAHYPTALPAWRELFAQRDRAEWLERFAGHDVCVGPVNDFAAAAADAQLRHRRMVVEVEGDDGGPHPQLGTPLKLRERPAAVRERGSRLGADSEHYLREAGLSSEVIEALVEDGVVATAASHSP